MAGRPRTRSDEQIFQAVLRAAGRAGSRGVTLADIAAEAGLAPSTLAERFGSKRALLLAAGRTAADGVEATFARAAGSTTSLAALADALVLLSAGLRTRAALAHHLGALQLDIADPDFRRLARQHAATLRRQLSLLLARAHAAGELTDRADPERLARTVQVTYNGALVSWGIGGRGSLEATLRDELEAVLAPWRSANAHEREFARLR